ncbi:Hsp70 family protein [Nocardia takedensis]|uniref:Hsp70 family protein n=1 Tax=Nocardia takedensis TaxID=259390 RepID=UPI00031D0535|nr:Hsp70 family protein [Nocardia takedensis]
MVLVLGVSAGAGGARAVLTHSDQPHLPPIERCHVPRRAGGGVEEAVLTAIRRMRRSADRRDEVISGAAVTCRSATHAERVREIAEEEPVIIVDEPLAQLRYLRFTGQLPDSGSVLLYDLGASGLTLTHVDCRTDAVLAAKHTTVVGGDGYDALLRWRLSRGGIRTDTATSRRHREALSSARVVTATDATSGHRAVITHSDLAELCTDGIHHTAAFVRRLLADSAVRPEALVLLGGCARSPIVREELADLIDLPVVYDPEPEYVSARGAVLVAADRHGEIRVSGLPRGGAVAAPRSTPPVGRRKVIAAVAVTLTLGATIAGLLAMERNSARAPEGGTAPTHVETGLPPHLSHN